MQRRVSLRNEKRKTWNSEGLDVNGGMSVDVDEVQCELNCSVQPFRMWMACGFRELRLLVFDVQGSCVLWKLVGSG
jgi:hypothetical protein